MADQSDCGGGRGEEAVFALVERGDEGGEDGGLDIELVYVAGDSEGRVSGWGCDGKGWEIYLVDFPTPRRS